MQSSSLSWNEVAVPSSERCFPAAQAMHSECSDASESSLSLYVPAAQTVQGPTAALLNFPIVHDSQVADESGSYQASGSSLPIGQMVQEPFVKDFK